MAIPRDNLTATPLESGRVLVVGGVGETTTELYDPPTGAWIPGGTLNQPRWLHEAVRLRDGRVLVAGGGTYTTSAELYDPATNRWTPTGSMHVDRYDFTATLLRDGRVLVVGGFSGNGTGVQASAELYDPATGRWTMTGSLGRLAGITQPRCWPTAPSSSRAVSATAGCEVRSATTPPADAGRVSHP